MGDRFRTCHDRFLAGVAMLGAAPVWTKLKALDWLQTPGTFTGDDFERVHALLRDTDATLGAYGTPEQHDEPDERDAAGSAGRRHGARRRSRSPGCILRTST